MAKQKRIAVIDRELCKPRICDYLCQRVCPVNRSGKKCIETGPDKKPMINEELCIGCGICPKKCPTQAITIVNLPEKLEEAPIHRYGKNMFSLYRLPIPKSGMVVGLIGPNGVGKSTVLNIVSGNIKPNTGLLEGGAAWNDIMQRFRGTELQDYVKRLSEKNITVAYKPQHVDSIPGHWKGRVLDLLRKADEKKTLDKVVSGLGAGELLEKDVGQLSGGELQLFAIIATLLRDRDFYFFDEPSSYLDVYERLLVAKEIRKLADSGKKHVMVVEHDLAVADYLADYTHILYGNPGVFGIVSKPYGVRIGINTYLEGYIREENVRFRTEPVVFGKSARLPEKTRIFMDFPGFRKDFRGFSLETEPGSIYRGEVIGILGPNAIGKTTFIRMLTGEVKPDKGTGIENLKLGYKPQRLMLEEEKHITVREFLARSSGLGKEEKRVVRFLGLEKLLERRMGNLSGGEFQSVLITSVLIGKADIMLFDEPSAFLDVEQRLRVAKLLREKAESREIPCFVVDHDLLFMDMIADRVMVFSGESGVRGRGSAPSDLRAGMNRFLKEMGVTYRRDPQTGRPRANKPGSQLDREQKESGEYYYSG